MGREEAEITKTLMYLFRPLTWVHTMQKYYVQSEGKPISHSDHLTVHQMLSAGHDRFDKSMSPISIALRFFLRNWLP